MRLASWRVSVAAAIAAGIGTPAIAAECSADCSAGQCHIRLEQRDGIGQHHSVRGDGQFVLAGAQRERFENQLTRFVTRTMADRDALLARLGDTAERFLVELEQALLERDWQHLVELRRQLRASLPGAASLRLAGPREDGAFCGCSVGGQPACERI